MKNVVIFVLVFYVSLPLFAQVGIGTTTPDTSAILEIKNATGGILVPRMTESDRDAIVSPAEGLLIYQIDSGAGFYYYNNSLWKALGGGSAWSTSGNSGTAPTTNRLGTTDVEDLSIVVNNVEGIRITADDKVGVNTNTPAASLHVVGSIRIQDGNEADGYVLTSDANGNGVWTDLTTGPGSDDDWAFVSGNTNTDPIYRIGGVTIGDDSVPGTTYFSDPLLHIKTEPSFFPAPESELGFGSNSYFSRSTQEIVVNNNVVPRNSNSINIGDPGYSWETIYLKNTPNTTSDRREKKDVQPLSHGLSTLLKLRPVTYIWKNNRLGKTILRDDQKETKIGFIAQELHEKVPEIVETSQWSKSTDGSGKYVKKKSHRLAVRYLELLPVLVNATKEHEVIIQDLEKQQQQIETLINDLK